MKLIASLLFASSALLSTNLLAQTVSGVEVNDAIKINQQNLLLNGAGVRSKFFIDLYVGSLYVPVSTQDANTIYGAPLTAIRLNITSGLITADKMRDAINEGFEHATDGNIAPLEAQITQFMSLFNNEIKEGDQFTLVFDKAAGVTAYKNDLAQATIAGDDFRLALMKIWLGDKPAQTSLKRAMLGE